MAAADGRSGLFTAHAVDRWAALVAGAWLGLLLCVALLAAPAAFAVLERPVAGRMVGAIFAREATSSVVLAAALMGLQRWRVKLVAAADGPVAQVDAQLLLAAAALFLTVAGHHGLQPWMDQARNGQGPLSFGQLHAVSVTLFALKTVLVGVLAWRLHKRSWA